MLDIDFLVYYSIVVLGGLTSLSYVCHDVLVSSVLIEIIFLDDIITV